MSRWLPLICIILAHRAAPLPAAPEGRAAPRRLAVLPVIPAAAGGQRLPGPQAAATADLLARSLAQMSGVVTASPSALYHAAVAAGGAGATTAEAAAQVARGVQAETAILVDAADLDRELELTAIVVPAEAKGQAPTRLTRRGPAVLDTDLFTLQSGFVHAVLEALKLVPPPEVARRLDLVLRGTASAVAFRHYAVARQQLPVASLDAYEAAVRALRRAIAADKEFALAHAALAEAASLLSMQQALTGLRDARLRGDALKAGQEAVRLRPELPDTHRALALSCALVADADAAAREAGSALAIRPDDPEARLWLGLAGGADGKQDILKALALDPGLALGHLFLAVLASRDALEAADDRQRQEARKTMVAECRKALDLCGSDPSPLLLTGMVQTGEGRIADAIATYQQVIDINPRTALAHAAIARLYYERGKQTEATDALKQALALDFRVGDLMRDQARFYQQAGEWEKADKEYQLLLLANPQDTPSWRGRGHLFLERGKLGDAAECFRSALEISPGDAWARVGLAMCYQRQNRDPDALQELQAAAAAQPDDGLVRLYLAQAYDRLNRVREATETYDQAVRIAPTLVEAAYSRAQFLDRAIPERAPAAWRAYLAAIEAVGGAQTDQEKERVRTAQMRLRGR
ncbi:MAG: tetratricopeptide repeat protein [Armatimonadetes bacterium]|nr:tetratricopeptide repeat protein [Armatimonadota bacterium]